MYEVKDVGTIKQVIKGVLTSFIVALLGVLIFAFVVKIAMLNNGVVKAVNQFLKVLSVFIGCSVCISKNLGLIKGAVIGLIFSIVMCLTFALIGSQISFDLSFILELILTSVIGGISGIIAVNMKRL